MCTCERTGSISCDSLTPGQMEQASGASLWPSNAFGGREDKRWGEERLLEGEEKAASSLAGRVGTLVAFHHQPNHPQSHPIWQNSNHRADLGAAPRNKAGAHAQAPIVYRLSNSSEVTVVGPSTKQFSSSSAFPLGLPTKRRPALPGCQGMLSTDPTSPCPVTILRFTWVAVLPWDLGGGTLLKG